MKPSPLRQFEKKWKAKVKSVFALVLILLGVLVVGYSIMDLIQVNKCAVCGEVILGKPERVEDTIPVCDRCYSMRAYYKIGETDEKDAVDNSCAADCESCSSCRKLY